MKKLNPLDVLKAKNNIFVKNPYAVLWGRKLSGGYEPAEATGTLPLTFRSNGTAILDYRIYGNTVETTLKTANLVPLTTQKTATADGITVTIGSDGVWHVTGTATSNATILFDLEEAFTVPTALDNGGEGVIQFFNSVAMDDGSGYETARVLFYYGNFQRDYMGLHIQNRSITQYSDLANKSINRLGIWVKQGITCDFTLAPMVVDDGIVHDEYISPETTEVQGVGVRVDITGLSEPLCGIQTYTDSLDLSTGILTRRIKKLVLTGEERYIKDSSADYLYYVYVMHMLHTNCFCSHLMSTTGYPTQKEGCSTYNNASIVYLNFGANVMNTQPSGNTPTGLQEYLSAQYAAGTPVTLWYVLAEPDVSTIPIPSGLAGAIEGYLIQDDTPTPETPIYPTANGVKQGDGTYSIKYGYKLPMVTVENLFNPDGTYEVNKFKNNDGIISTYNGEGYYTQYIPINSEDLISVKNARGNNNLTIRLYYYDSQKKWIGRSGGNGYVTDFTETPLSGAAFIQLQLGTPYTANADKIIISQGETTVPVYIGDTQLMQDEYVRYSEQKIYKKVNGTLTPQDPPVPLPELPTFSDTDTVLDYEETPAPEEVWVKYKKGD